MMPDQPKPYPKNVEGDFYVEDGCCITCLVPEFYAPDLMGFDNDAAHCFVARQPKGEAEVYQLIKAAWAAEVGCIRYGGNDSQILRRLAEAGVSDSCDQKHLVREIKPLLRNHVTFEDAETQSELEIISRFKEYLLSQNTEYLRYKTTKTFKGKFGVGFSFSWYEANYYKVWVSKTESLNAWHIFHSPDFEAVGSRSVSLQIDEWLRSKGNAYHIKWFTDKAWHNFQIEWQRTAI